jgi:hypothetical protein
MDKKLGKINMKYLTINQTHLKADDKYSYMHYSCNNFKCRFNKYYAVGHYNELFFTLIFIKYMNYDVKIIWNI